MKRRKDKYDVFVGFCIAIIILCLILSVMQFLSGLNDIQASEYVPAEVVYEEPEFFDFCAKSTLPGTKSLNGWISGTAKCDLMYQAGITSNEEQFYADQIITHESNWTMDAENESTSSYGYCQANPNWHELSDTYKTDAIEQLKWCDAYAMDRYGSWEEAYVFWINNEWW